MFCCWVWLCALKSHVTGSTSLRFGDLPLSWSLIAIVPNPQWYWGGLTCPPFKSPPSYCVFLLALFIVSTTLVLKSAHGSTCISHVNPQYHCGFGRIAVKLQLTGKSRLIFNSQPFWESISNPKNRLDCFHRSGFTKGNYGLLICCEKHRLERNVNAW